MPMSAENTYPLPGTVLDVEKFEQPVPRLAEVVQDVGFSAWSRATGRIRGEIIQVYDAPLPEERLSVTAPTRPNQRNLLERMNYQAANGRFSGVIASLGGEAVGTAWAYEIAGRRFRQRTIQVEDLNVRPEHQGKGFGSALLFNLLEPYGHRQPVRIDFPLEIARSEWLDNRGFRHRRGLEKAHIFGEAIDPVDMHRQEADRVDFVRHSLMVRNARSNPSGLRPESSYKPE